MTLHTEDEAREKWTARGRKNGHSKGYIRVLCPEHPNANCDGYVYEHLFVATNALGRGLVKGETVHHINGVPDDNSSNNLLVCTHAYHRQLHSRLALSPDWPQFDQKRWSKQPKCRRCDKRIPYDTKTGLCREHWVGSPEARRGYCGAFGRPE